MKYFRKVSGENVYLSPMNVDNLERHTKWMNDPEVTGYLGMYHKVLSLASEKASLERMTAEGYNFAIVRAQDDVSLGWVSLLNVDLVNRRAMVGIFIGDAENRDKGYGTEAMRLVLGYGFSTLGLNNIMLGVHSDNPRAIASYKKIGFREVGRRRESLFKGGRWIDLIYMDILPREIDG